MDDRRAWWAYLWLVLGAALLGGLVAAMCGGARAATSYVVNSASDVRPSIVPVWTARHTFNGTISVGSAIYLTLLPNAAFLGTAGGGQVAAGSVTAPLAATGNVLSITQASAGASGYLSAGDWTAFNSKLSSESDPLSLHASGGTNTMFQSILANSSAYNVGSGGTPFGSIYANNYYLGGVDVLFTSSGSTFLGSGHSVFLNPGGGAGGASALPTAPVGYLKIQVDGTTYAFPYYNP